MSSVSGSSSRSTWSSVSSRSPGGRAADDDPAVVDRRGVERVDRLAELEHHVVRGVDDVADRAQAGGQQAHLDPVRRRADRHAARPSGRRSAGTGPGRGRRPRGARAIGRPDSVDVDRGQPERRRRSPPRPRARARRSTARRRGSASRRRRGRRRRTGRRAARPSGVSAGRIRIPSASAVSPSSSPEQSMPLLTTPIFSVRSIRRLPGRTAPGSATGTRWPGGDVRRAADDLERLAVARRDRVSDSRSARGCRSTVSSSPTTTLRQSAPQRSIALDLHPEQRQPLGELLRRQVDVDELAQPGQRHPHRNCSRKRRSFSMYRRRSPTPCRSIAIRSDAHAEREALVPLGVDAAVAQHDRVDHAGAEDRHPAGPRAGRAPAPSQTTHRTSNATDGSVNG